MSGMLGAERCANSRPWLIAGNRTFGDGIGHVSHRAARLGARRDGARDRCVRISNVEVVGSSRWRYTFACLAIMMVVSPKRT